MRVHFRPGQVILAAALGASAALAWLGVPDVCENRFRVDGRSGFSAVFPDGERWQEEALGCAGSDAVPGALRAHGVDHVFVRSRGGALIEVHREVQTERVAASSLPPTRSARGLMLDSNRTRRMCPLARPFRPSA